MAGSEADGRRSEAMHELLRTNNPVLISVVEALLKAADIPHVVLDQHMSVMEGSLGMLPQRIVVGDDYRVSARRLLADAGLAHELRLSPAVPGEGGGETPDGSDADITDDAALGGRLRLFQKRSGHRFGHDAILLAAAAQASGGDRVVDLGAGVGAAGLALAMRVADLSVTLVERDPELAALARRNIERNGLGDRAVALALDVRSAPEIFSGSGLEPGSADGVIMNPPFNDPARLNASPDPHRRAAHIAANVEGELTLDGWLAAAAGLLHTAGRLALIWRADGLAEVLAALPPRFGAVSVLPVHGRPDRPAIRVIVRASRGGRAPLRLLPALHLNDAAGRPTAAAEDVLRRALPLPD